MDTKRNFKYIQILVLYLLKIFPHKIIFKTQKKPRFLNFIILSIGFFMHKVSLKNRNFPQETNVNESPCKITFRLFSMYDNLKCALIDSQPYIFNDSRNYFPFHTIDKKPSLSFRLVAYKAFRGYSFMGRIFPLCSLLSADRFYGNRDQYLPD